MGFTLRIGEEKEKPREVKVNAAKLARQTGYSKSHLSRVFNRETKPSVKCLAKLVEVLGIPMGELYDLISKGKVKTFKVGKGGKGGT